MRMAAEAKFKSTSTFDIKPGDLEKHIKAFQALDPDQLTKVFTKAMKAAARPIASEMRKLAPVGKTGELKKSITVRVYKVRHGGSGTGKVHARVRIGPSARKGRIGGRYAHLVELGTKAGTRISRKREFRIFGQGEEVEVSSISHPGTRPQPFIRVAFHNKEQKANTVIREKLLKEFDTIIADHLK